MIKAFVIVNGSSKTYVTNAQTRGIMIIATIPSNNKRCNKIFFNICYNLPESFEGIIS